MQAFGHLAVVKRLMDIAAGELRVNVFSNGAVP